MTECVNLLLAWVVGLLVGAVVFGGLWWTIRLSVTSRRPALWFIGSFILRMSAAVTGFYFVGRAQWQSLLMCLLGFVIARFIATWLTRPPVGQYASLSQQAGHAP